MTSDLLVDFKSAVEKSVMVLNFSNKIIRGINFEKKTKKIVSVEVSIVRLNSKSNTLNKSIEKMFATTKHTRKIKKKKDFHRKRSTL